MNTITLMGRLTREPEFRTTDTGKSVANYTLAVDRIGDKVDFIRCVAWERNAEFARSYLHKGMKIIAVGSLHINKRNDKEYAEVVVEKTYFCETRKKAEEWSDMTDDEELPF